MSFSDNATPNMPAWRAVPVLKLAPPALLDAVPVGPTDVLTVLPAAPALDVLPAHCDEAPLTAASAEPVQDPLVRAFWAVVSIPEWLFGAAALTVGLAVLAALPILQFLSLGYLLESSGRIARTGRLRDGFIGVRLAARLGGIVVGSWLFLLPVRFVADLARSAAIIDPGGRIAAQWRAGLFVLIAMTFAHIAVSCALGGRLWHFIPGLNMVFLLLRLIRGNWYTQARDGAWNTVMALRLPYYFWLGFRGAIAAFAWLVVPISLIAVSRSHAPIAPLVGFIGALMLIVVLVYLPFLQLRMAATNRLSAAFEVLAVRRDYRKAPWAFAFAFFITLLFALPLYLLKIQIVPREAAWLPSLVFVSFIFPARLLTGWAMGRAMHRPQPRHWFFRWTGRLPFVPAAAFYVLIVFFTQYTSWNGVWSLYEQHAFLVPVPFFGM